MNFKASVRAFFDNGLRQVEISSASQDYIDPSTRVLLVYEVENHSFAYYPDDIAGVLDDIRGEISALESGNSHEVTIGGYPVLLASLGVEDVELFDPSKHDGISHLSFVGAFKVSDIITHLKETVGMVESLLGEKD